MPGARAKTQGLRILLVEDELDDAAAVRRALPEAAGFTVEHFRLARDALDAAAGGALFHAAIIDHRLTDLSGVEVCRRLRAAGFAGPVLLLSSVEQDAVIARAMEAGADEFVLKTADYGERLQEAVRLAR